jgi:hypothetical protein
MKFGEILSKAWKVIWKHKILWLFGLLAGCGVAGSGGSNGGGSGASSASTNYQQGNWEGLDFLSPSAQRGIEEFFRNLADIPVGVWIAIGVGIFLVMLIFSALFMMLGTLGITGVVKGTSMADEAGKDEKPLSLKAVFAGLKPAYWKVFLLNFGLRIAGFVVTSMLVVLVILFTVLTCGLGLLLMIPIGWLVNTMVNFSTIAIVEEGLGVFPAISRAWKVLIKNLGNVILMFLILGVGKAVIGVLLGLPIFVSFMPITINGIATGFNNITTGLAISGVLLIIFIPLMIFLGGVLRAYVWSAWTLTYRRLIGKESIEPEVILAKDEEEKAD